MRKKEFKIISTAIYVGFVLVYLAFSFVMADFNPFAWSKAARALMVALSLGASLICSAAGVCLSE